MQNEVVTRLLAHIAAESCVACDVFDRAGDSIFTDDNTGLQVIDMQAQKVRACRYVGVNRQAR